MGSEGRGTASASVSLDRITYLAAQVYRSADAQAKDRIAEVFQLPTARPGRFDDMVRSSSWPLHRMNLILVRARKDTGRHHDEAIDATSRLSASTWKGGIQSPGVTWQCRSPLAHIMLMTASLCVRRRCCAACGLRGTATLPA